MPITDKEPEEMRKQSAIDRIYNRLCAGDSYGRPVWDVSWPYFETVLWRYENRGHWYIGYKHFGSSAVTDNTDKLRWLIRTIFDMTPEQFEKEYISRDTLKYIAN